MGFYAARQPILDIDKNVYGYELLFRTSLQNVFPNVDEEKATSKMIEGLQLDLGLDRIAEGKLAFINFTQQSLLSAYPELLPKEKVVIEVLETATPTKQLYKIIKNLHHKGYLIALDDYVHQPAWELFYPFIHIIKIDYLDATQAQIEATIEAAKKYIHIKLLAEKIETHSEFNEAKALGFHYFQGYFFSRPEVIKSVALSPSQSVLSNLLSEVNREEPNFNAISKMFEMDVSLSFKLLRYTQSPLFQRSRKIENIKQAVLVLGKNELQRFVTLLFAAQFGEGKPTELIFLSMQRARFCEILASKTGYLNAQSSAFLGGMLSLLDAMLDADLKQVINSLPVSTDIKNALSDKIGWLAECIKLCEQFELTDWKNMEEGCSKLRLDFQDVLQEYTNSTKWAEQRMRAIL